MNEKFEPWRGLVLKMFKKIAMLVGKRFGYDTLTVAMYVWHGRESIQEQRNL